MNSGILIYGFSNEKVDYWNQAVWCADRARRFLNQPVTIVTDQDSRKDRPCDHHVIFTDAVSGGHRVYNPTTDSGAASWYNKNRYQSYDISPYEKTIVLDSDYVVCSDQLNLLFQFDWPVTAMKSVYDITGRDSFNQYKSISTESVSLHHYWATVLYFDKSITSEYFFRVMTMIQRYYRHYSNLYKFPASPFRNDFAVSIALNIVYGHVPDAVPTIPWTMANVGDDVDISEIDSDEFEFRYLSYKDKSLKKIKVKSQDFHFMNKKSLANLYER